jgi:PhoH-like ATPase
MQAFNASSASTARSEKSTQADELQGKPEGTMARALKGAMKESGSADVVSLFNAGHQAPVHVAAPQERQNKPQVAKIARAIAPVEVKHVSKAPMKVVESKGKGKAPKASLNPKLFVLDTNVLLHDPSSLFHFAEHDVFIPMIVLEELDGHKKGLTDLARHARHVSRSLDQLASDLSGVRVKEGLPLDAMGNKEATGRLFFQTEAVHSQLPTELPQGKADNQILAVFDSLRRKHSGREVVLVSKDINMRIKARALGLEAEDYTNDQSLEDAQLLYAGSMELPIDFWDSVARSLESWEKEGRSYYRFESKLVSSMHVNQFLYLHPHDEPPWCGQVISITGKSVIARTVKDYNSMKHAVMGVTSRNREQNFALNMLMDPEIDFVTLAGTAGTGKTLMVLAAGLQQIVNDKRYNEIVFTRATVPVGEEIGFLPGTEEEKMAPWMGAVDDNLEVLAKGGNGAGEWGHARTAELIKSKIKIKSMSFMRGRTFQGKFLIIDEAQNLTPKQMKTLITRAGPGTKIVCMGNLAQIDTPYLTEGSSGLTYAVERFKGWPHGGHITLAKGERSRLADFASDVL